MAFLAALAPYISAAAAVGGAVQQRETAHDAKMAADKQASIADVSGVKSQAEQEQQALQLEASANADRASSQRDASEALRRAQLSKSRAIAVASASGSSNLDPSVVNIISGFDAQGQLAADSANYAGEESAKSKEYGAWIKRNTGEDMLAASGYQADAYRTSGRNAVKAGNAAATGTILNGVSNFASSYSQSNQPEKVKRDYDALNKLPSKSVKTPEGGYR